MLTNSRAPKRTRGALSETGLPKVPVSLRSLRDDNFDRFVTELISFLKTIPVHPRTDIGWWCCYPDFMQDLVLFLSDPQSHQLSLWSDFRNCVASQLSNCRQCATKYHNAVGKWELSDVVAEWPAATTKRRVKSLLDWNTERLMPSILRGANISTSDPASGLAANVQCREAFLESLVSLRVCMDRKYAGSLGTVFRKRNPARDDEDLAPFIRSLAYLPPGILALSFHPSTNVRSWAHRVYKRFYKQFSAPRPSLYFLLKRAVRFFQSFNSATHSTGKKQENLCPIVLWDGFTVLFCSLPRTPLQLYVNKNSKRGALCEVVANALASSDSSIVENATTCLTHLLVNIPFDFLFDMQNITPEIVLDIIFRSFNDSTRDISTKRLLLEVLGPLLRASMDKGETASMTNLFQRCFDYLYEASQTRKENGVTGYNAATMRKSRKDTLRTGASLLSIFYSRMPALPLKDPKRIAHFVLEVLSEEPEKEWTWNLFRTVLITDVFNLLRNMKDERDVKMIGDSFLSQRPPQVVLSADEEEVMSKIILSCPGSKRMVTWVGPLWDAVKNNKHLPSRHGNANELCLHEVKVFLDLHRLIGLVDEKRLHLLVENEKISCSLFYPSNSEVSKSQKYFICKCLRSAQEAVEIRLSTAFSSTAQQEWWKQLPFHATHLLSSARPSLSTEAFKALQNSYKLRDAHVSGSQSRLLAQLMSNDSAAASNVSEGCVSSMRMISALGAHLSVRTYACFFLWFRVLLESKYEFLLERNDSAKWALSVIRTFVDNWKAFEETTDNSVFQEACCRFLSNICDVWKHFFSPKTEEVEQHTLPDKVQQWMNTVMRGLLNMHKLKNHTALCAWANSMRNLGPSWGKVREHRENMVRIIRFHEKERSGLSFEQCFSLAKAVSLDEAEPVLSMWGHDPRMVMKISPYARRSYQGTKIDAYFPKAQPKASAEAHVPKLVSGLSSQYARSGPSANLAVSKKIQKRQGTARIGGGNRLGGRALNPNVNIMELRKDHKLARQASRQIISKKVEVSRPTNVSGLTKFELQRLKMEELKTIRNSRPLLEGIQPVQPSRPALRGKNVGYFKQVFSNSSKLLKPECVIDPIQVLREKLTFPPNCRRLERRLMDRVLKPLLSNNNLVIPEVSKGRVRECRDVESYVKYWEPLLVAEFRASVETSVREEEMFAEREKNRRTGKYSKCRAVFEVQGPPEDIGYLQTISLKLSNDEAQHFFSNDIGTSELRFDSRRLQPSDIVLLHIPPPKFVEHSSKNEGSTPCVGLVSNVDRKGNCFIVKLKVTFNGVNSAPGTGRRVRISRLTSLATFQRQIDGLWGLAKASESVLWSVLEPKKACEVKSQLDKENAMALDVDSEKPLQFVADMKTRHILNDSQAGAIRSVIRSCGSLFRQQSVSKSPEYFMPNRGSISLIQGPPGTGKTSTIISLLSALLAQDFSKPRTRKAKVTLETGPYIMNIPFIRVLVCAPSNAAVDEIMLRIMKDGLLTTSGSKVSPRMVRVGSGTTVNFLQNLELRKLAGVDVYHDQHSPHDSSSAEQIRTRKISMDALCTKIEKVDNERKKVSTAQVKLESLNVHGAKSEELSKKYRLLSAELNQLYGKKRELHSLLTQDRDAARESIAAKKREDIKSMCNVLNHASIVFATLSSAGQDSIRNLSANFDVIIVDEAAQCCEPDVLIPMTLDYSCRSKSSSSHVVLVGDPKQLPATVLSNNSSVCDAMGTSLFQRLADEAPSRVHMLNTQYRMHPRISSFPSQQFYDGRLLNGANVKCKSMHQAYHRDEHSRFGPLTFIDTSPVDTHEMRRFGGSLCNPREAQMVIDSLTALFRLYRRESLTNEVVVLSPYRQQVALLKKMVCENRELSRMEIECSTIDGIQGREKSIVLLSTVRSGSAKDIGFVKDDRRMNVAITRAKHSLITFGHAPVLSRHSQSWASLVSHCRVRSCLREISIRNNDLFPEAERCVHVRCARRLPPLEEMSEIEDDMDRNWQEEETPSVILATSKKRGWGRTMEERHADDEIQPEAKRPRNRGNGFPSRPFQRRRSPSRAPYQRR